MAEFLNFAVIGHPIAHSRSPEIHAAFARQFDISLHYQRIDAEPAAFQQQVAAFFQNGGRGMNVTLPHKASAFVLSRRSSARAQRAAAVNTLHQEDGQLVGDNTDGIGLIRDLQRLADVRQIVLSSQRVLMLGAGGAARGALAGLLDAGLESIHIVARDAAKAHALAAAFNTDQGVVALDRDAGSFAAFDMVINATSAGLSGEAPATDDRWLRDAWLGYDLSYPPAGHSSTPFLNYCRAHHVAVTADGVGMLVEQAAESFFGWHGKRPDVLPVLELLRRRS